MQVSPSSRRGPRMLLFALAGLVGLLVLLYLVWGFRWTPTAGILTHAEQADVERRIELDEDEAPREP